MAATTRLSKPAFPPLGKRTTPLVANQLNASLLEMSADEKAAIAINEAMHGRCYERYPDQKSAWYDYRRHTRMDGWLKSAKLGLLVLTLFETPLWCDCASRAGYWEDWDPFQRCVERGGGPAANILMSNMPMVPCGVGLVLELGFLLALAYRSFLLNGLAAQFVGCDGGKTRSEVIFDLFMITIGLVDLCIFGVNPDQQFRIAPYVRFGLAATVPWVHDLLYSFWRVLQAISKVGTFLVGTVVIFAWLASMIFDDVTSIDRYGVPINEGFETFGNALYTSFATMTTAILPDVMIPSYVKYRPFVLLWMPFLMLATIIFTNVILATVYSEYQDHATKREKRHNDRRMKSLHTAFDLLKQDRHGTDGQGDHSVVRFDTFVLVCKLLKSLAHINVDEHLVHLVYHALDQNGDGTLNSEEFYDLCDMLQTNLVVTTRDGNIRMHIQNTRKGKVLYRIMDNGADGPDLGYTERFPGSLFDGFMNFVLSTNVLWIVLQSCVDLWNVPEPGFFQGIDIFFCLIYLIEVGLKLCYWSWGHYWMNKGNRFDFVTTMILAAAALWYMLFTLDNTVLRFLNMLRLVRLLKALNNIPAYRAVWSVIERMVCTASRVLAMNFLVIYLWSAAGVQLFGGQLYQSNPRFQGKGKDLDYFASHYQVYNFNDMFMGMVTLCFFMLGGWIDQIACVCMALAGRFTAFWFLTYAFFLTFYVASPLLAFNVFTSFSIDVFCTVQAMDQDEPDELTCNLTNIKAQMADEEGRCLHIEDTSELSRAKVFRKMFSKD